MVMPGLSAGLATCRKIVDGSRLQLSSEVGEGSVFSFELRPSEAAAKAR